MAEVKWGGICKEDGFSGIGLLKCWFYKFRSVFILAKK